MNIDIYQYSSKLPLYQISHKCREEFISEKYQNYKISYRISKWEIWGIFWKREDWSYVQESDQRQPLSKILFFLRARMNVEENQAPGVNTQAKATIKQISGWPIRQLPSELLECSPYLSSKSVGSVYQERNNENQPCDRRSQSVFWIITNPGREGIPHHPANTTRSPLAALIRAWLW